METSNVRVGELAHLLNKHRSTISNSAKNLYENFIEKSNNRVVGITPDGVSQLLSDNHINCFQKPAIILSANLCGGTGKTSSILNLGACLRRVSPTNHPIVYVDTDSQASFTTTMTSEPADDNEPILADYLEGKVRVEDILTNIGNNVWFVKSNLNQVWSERILSKPKILKTAMNKFYSDVFNYLGNETKIFQDHTPQLSAIFGSSIAALPQIENKDALKSVIIPMRGDNYSIQGCRYILQEIDEIIDTFHLKRDLDIHNYISIYDRRVSTTAKALRAITQDEKIMQYFSSTEIRYCSAIPKSIDSGTNIYTHNYTSTAARDYLDLLYYIFNYNQENTNA